MADPASGGAVQFLLPKKRESLEELVARLYPNRDAQEATLFRQLNGPYAANGHFDVAQPVFLPEDTGMCMAHEPTIAEVLEAVNAEHERMRPQDRQTVAQTHAVLDFVLEYGNAGFGATTAAYAQRVSRVTKILKEIERAFTWEFRHNGHLRTDAFLRFRRAKFRELDVALGTLVRSLGFQPHRTGKMKAQLGIHTKSQILQWQRAGYADGLRTFPGHYKNIGRLASGLKGVGYASIALDVGLGAKNIHDACSIEDAGDHLCARTSYEEVGRVGGSIALGGLGGFGVSYVACNLVLGAPTVGTSLVWCGFIATGVGAAAGGYLGGMGGEYAGRRLFENTYPMN